MSLQTEYRPHFELNRLLAEEQETNALLRKKIRLLEAQTADLQRTAAQLAAQNYRMKESLQRIERFAYGFPMQAMRHVWEIAVQGLREEMTGK